MERTGYDFDWKLFETGCYTRILRILFFFGTDVLQRNNQFMQSGQPFLRISGQACCSSRSLADESAGYSRRVPPRQSETPSMR